MWVDEQRNRSQAGGIRRPGQAWAGCLSLGDLEQGLPPQPPGFSQAWVAVVSYGFCLCSELRKGCGGRGMGSGACGGLGGKGSAGT